MPFLKKSTGPPLGVSLSEQSLRKQKPQRAALPATISRGSRFLRTLKSGFRSPSLPEYTNYGSGQPIAISASQLLTSLDPEPYSKRTVTRPTLTIPTVSSSRHGSLSSPYVQVSASASVSAPTSVPKSTPGPDVIEPSPYSSIVWAKASDITKKKLSDSNLPPLDLINLTSQSAKEGIEGLIRALNTLQEGNGERRWNYIWREREVLVIERLGKIRKSVEKYVATVLPQLSALVCASAWAIMQVALNHIEAIEGFEVAIAVLLEKMFVCEFYTGIYTYPVRSTDNNMQLQSIRDSALPELFAAIVVFAVKARTYFEARGIKRSTAILNTFDIEFQPFIEEINAKEGVIRAYVDGATMERIRDIEGVLQDITSQLKPLAKLHDISTTNKLQLTERNRDSIKDRRTLELLEKLTPLEPLKRHRDIKLSRTENTGTWLLNLESFREWCDGNTEKEGGHVFCCYGIPGAGKTVICSVVIDDLYFRFNKDPDTGIACLYADYKDQSNQTLVPILGSFLRQLLTSSQDAILDEVIQILHNIQKQGGKLGPNDILTLLKLRLHQLKQAFICIDAVDELEPSVRQQLLNLLKDLVTNNRNICLFLTARGNIEGEVQKKFNITQKYRVEISASQRDIQQFVGQQIKGDHDLNPEAIDTILAKDIEDTIIENSKGMLPPYIKIVGHTPLSWAADKGHEAVVRQLIEGNVDINAKDGDDCTPIICAARNGYEAIVQLLIERADIDINAKDSIGRTPLLWAAEKGHEAVVRLLIEGDVDINARDGDGCTPIICAAKNGHVAVVRLLIKRDDIDINAKDKNRRTPLMWAAEGGYEDVVRLLIERGDVDMNAKDILGRTPLTLAAEEGHEALVRLLIERYDVDVNAQDRFGRTPLSLTAKNRHEAIVRLLMTRDDIDIDAKDYDGRTTLSWAAEAGNEAVISLLIERGGVDMNAKDILGRTPLSWASEAGNEAAISLLIERGGVDMNAKDRFKRTPLLWAAEGGHVAVVRLLIGKGNVDIDAEDMHGRTPLSWAAENGYEAVVRLLQGAG